MSNAFDKSTLVMVPSAYKAGKLYSVKPPTGTGDFEFGRSSGGTRINEDGDIELMGNNVPRLEHGGECPVLLCEKACTNFILNSLGLPVNFSGSGITISFDGIYKGQPVVRLDFPDATGAARAAQYNFLIQSGLLTYGCYLKASANSNVLFGFGASPPDSGIINVTTEWEFKELSRTVSSKAAAYLFRRDGYTNTAAITVWMCAPQVNAGDCALSYIPTSGSAGTRAKDELSLEGLQSKGILNSGTGTWVEHFTRVEAGEVLSLGNGGESTKLIVEEGSWKLDVDGTKTTIGAYVDDSQVAIRWDADEIAVVLNGANEVGTNVPYEQSYTSYTLGNVAVAKKKLIAAYAERLSEAECKALTEM